MSDTDNNTPRRVEIPPYAKRKANGTSIYAHKKDLPYFKTVQYVAGNLVIGHVTEDDPTHMIPTANYEMYCGEDAVERGRKDEEKRQAERAEALRRAEEEKKEQERRQREKAAVKEKTHGWYFIPLSETSDDFNPVCHPVIGYLAEKFFEETGLDGIFDKTFGTYRAFWMRLYTAAFASYGWTTLTFEDLNMYPMKDHLVHSADAQFTLWFLDSITQEEITKALNLWIGKAAPDRVLAMKARSTLTLFHSDRSDHFGDGWMMQRIRTGTRNNRDYIVYQDADTGRILSYEPLQYDLKSMHSDDVNVAMDTSHEAYTVKNSTFPAFRNAPLVFYLSPYDFLAKNAMKQLPATVCLYPSAVTDKKGLKKHLAELEAITDTDHAKFVRWDGTWEGIPGHFALMEYPWKREWMLEQAKDYLRRQKPRLQTMSYYAASESMFAQYFDIEQTEDALVYGDITDSQPGKVSLKKGATNMLRQDAGRYLWFTTGDPIPDNELIRELWYCDDIDTMWNCFLDHGETTDLTQEFLSSLLGWDFVQFFSELFREWIFDHVGDKVLKDDEILLDFFKVLEGCSCEIKKDGTVKLSDGASIWDSDLRDKKAADALALFGATLDDVAQYMRTCIQKPDYFSDHYGNEDEDDDDDDYY